MIVKKLRLVYKLRDIDEKGYRTNYHKIKSGVDLINGE